MIRNTRELVMGEPQFLLQVALVGLALPTIYTTSVYAVASDQGGFPVQMASLSSVFAFETFTV